MLMNPLILSAWQGYDGNIKSFKPDTTDAEKSVIALKSISFRAHRSFIIQHSNKLQDEFTQSNPWILDAEISWHLRKKGVWDYCSCFPRTGFALNYINFDLGDTLGSAIATYAFIEPYIVPSRRLSMAIRFGLGPAFMTSVYDEISNPDNLFFSSRVSFIALIGITANIRLKEQFSLKVAGQFNHISNSGVKEPNLGMNFPSLSMGLDYNFTKPQFPEYQKSGLDELQPKKNRFDLILSSGLKAPEWKIEQKLYLVTAVGVNYSRVFGRNFALSIGGEWVTDRTIKAYVSELELTSIEGEPLDHNRISTLVGIEWLFGRFIFSQQFGYYLYSPVQARHQVYQRYGLSLKITDHLYGGINIKAHAQNADFLEIRLGLYL